MAAVGLADGFAGVYVQAWMCRQVCICWYTPLLVREEHAGHKSYQERTQSYFQAQCANI